MEESETNEKSINEYSGWGHCYRHFIQQLFNLKCKNVPLNSGDIFNGLRNVLGIINQKRLYSGADSRINGINTNKIEPCNIILFTA
jgi:hypothetical protein